MRTRTAALCLLFALILASLVIVMAPGSSYSNQDRESTMAGASSHHLAGTDELGRDRLVRLSAAFLLSLSGSIVAAGLTTLAAAAIGLLAAFSGVYLGGLAMLLCDVFLALPWLFLLMMVRSALPLTASPAHSAAITFLVLAALGWPACARAVYRGVKNLRTTEWMLQARAGGLGGRQIARHVLPNLTSLLLPQFLISIPAFIIAEANLGALGLGIGEPLPSWGGMLLELDNSAMLMRTSWVYLPIALLIGVLLLFEAIAVEAR